MAYHDIIHQQIEFGHGPEGSLVNDLLACPEVQRLRHIRLLNFDVPLLQELATSRRFAHAVGTCYLTTALCSRSFVPADQRKVLIASALLHDIGVLPYGHLVETALQGIDADFSHETLFRDIVHGTYHRTNIYHQILPGQSLRVAHVLRKHGVDPDDVIGVVQPRSNTSSAICGDIDIDNIDSVHRMAALIGLDEGRANMDRVLRHASVTNKGQLAFDGGALEAISVWSDLRAALYSLMIGHPDCVAYNAYVYDLVRLALDNGLIAPDEWHLNDRQFEERLLQHERTKGLAAQLLHGCQYTLVDYVWLRAADDPQWRGLAHTFQAHMPEPPVLGTRYFTWFERGKIERAKTILVTGAGRQRLGQSSASLLVALVSPGPGHKSATDDFMQHQREAWRSTLVARANQIVPGIDFRVAFPEDFVLGRIQLRERTIQHALF